MNKCKVLGFKNVDGNGKYYCNLYVQQVFNEYELNNYVVGGVKVESVYIKGVNVNNDIVGKEIELVYGVGYQGKAVVTNFSIVK